MGIFDDAVDSKRSHRGAPEQRSLYTPEEQARMARMYPSLAPENSTDVYYETDPKTGERTPRYPVTERHQAEEAERARAHEALTATDPEAQARKEQIEIDRKRETARKIAMYPSLAHRYDENLNPIHPNGRPVDPKEDEG